MLNDEPESDEIIDVDSAEEEFGYTDLPWSEIDHEIVDLHDHVITLSADQLDETMLQHESHLIRWAAAQVLADHDDFEAFERVALSIVREDWSDLAVNYEEIAGELFIDACLDEKAKMANIILKNLEEKVGGKNAEVQRLRAFRAMVFESRDAGLAAYQRFLDEYDGEPDLVLQVCYDFILFEEFAFAEELIEATSEEAEMNRDEELISLLNDAQQVLEQARSESRE